MFVRVYFEPEGQITQQLAVMVHQIETEKNVYLLCSNELESTQSY